MTAWLHSSYHRVVCVFLLQLSQRLIEPLIHSPGTWSGTLSGTRPRAGINPATYTAGVLRWVISEFTLPLYNPSPGTWLVQSPLLTTTRSALAHHAEMLREHPARVVVGRESSLGFW